MQLSQNQKIFSRFFSALSEYAQSLRYFERKDDPQRWFFAEIIECKMQGYLMPKKPPVRKPMDSQHVKGSERLLKSAT